MADESVLGLAPVGFKAFIPNTGGKGYKCSYCTLCMIVMVECQFILVGANNYTLQSSCQNQIVLLSDPNGFPAYAMEQLFSNGL